MIKHLVYIIAAVVFVMAYMRYFEHRSIYFPDKEIGIVPDEVGLSYEDIYLHTDDGVRLNAWFIPAEDSKYTVLLSHGNAGNISDRIEKIRILNSMGLDVFIFDYRGYGRSGGRPSERGLYKDIQAVYDYMVSQKGISGDRIIVYGESLGGAVGLDLAGKNKIRALIIEGTFTSVEDISKAVYPRLPAFLISTRYDNFGKIRDITVPKLIIHSRNDGVVPFSHSLKLFEISPGPKKHLTLKGTHGDCFLESRDLYVSGIREFIEGL